jgi:PadR family transcriptional regulator, regulatory protein PadR
MARRSSSNHQELYIGLVRLHALHHAAHEPIFGMGLIKELARHGYRLGPGTIYPLLHSMERRGWLHSKPLLVGKRKRRTYRATRAGREALKKAREQVRELLEELLEHSD